MEKNTSQALRTRLLAIWEKGMALVFLLAALVSILCVGLICVFLFANGIPAMREIGVPEFLLGRTWKPGNDIYGIFPMIVGSVYVTGGALLLGVPIALLTAVYLAYFCPDGLYRLLKPAVELLAGIPSWSTAFSASWCWCPSCARSASRWTARATPSPRPRSCWRS